ncbi:hypothetical protein OESDEN_14365 [Oesophagostomum dentatum]|uniref:Uncharacterized protein n=1 Tax=Oesophagostomum dentatum TaxID=61180 RepID=A0A0B1SKN5_OESDE|nr:hypothetical protein OESDEN_14365 [Oesophagostomum dentatum]
MQICNRRKVIVLGEGSFLFLLIARIATTVTVVDTNSHFRDIMERYISYYNYDNVTVVESVADVSADTAAGTMMFYFRWVLCTASVRSYDHLQKTAAPVGTVNGFDLSLFDDLSQKARQATTALVDVHPLWEYSGVATSEKFEILRFDLRKDPHDIEGNIEIALPEGTNGIPLWMEWQIGNYILTTGLKHSARTGETPEWKEGVRQGVYLLSLSLLGKKSIRIDACFDRQAGEVNFQFY